MIYVAVPQLAYAAVQLQFFKFRLKERNNHNHKLFKVFENSALILFPPKTNQTQQINWTKNKPILYTLDSYQNIQFDAK